MLFSNDSSIWQKELFIYAGFSYCLSSILSNLGHVIIVLFLSWLSNLMAKTIILQIVTGIVKRTKSNSAIESLLRIYITLPISQHSNIKGYVEHETICLSYPKQNMFSYV